jgi:hypothetical protein
LGFEYAGGKHARDRAPYFPNGKVLIAHKGGHDVAWPIVQQQPEVAGELTDFLRTGDLKDIPDEVTLR